MTAQWIVRCLKRDLNTAEQRIKYAEMIASNRGEHAHLYAAAAEMLRKEN